MVIRCCLCATANTDSRTRKKLYGNSCSVARSVLAVPLAIIPETNTNTSMLCNQCEKQLKNVHTLEAKLYEAKNQLTIKINTLISKHTISHHSYKELFQPPPPPSAQVLPLLAILGIQQPATSHHLQSTASSNMMTAHQPPDSSLNIWTAHQSPVSSLNIWTAHQSPVSSLNVLTAHQSPVSSLNVSTVHQPPASTDITRAHH